MLIKNTEILVVGGGMAGIMAAISASQFSDKVILVSKGLVGKSGNTLVSGGGIAAATDDENNTAEKFYEDIMKSGKGLAKSILAKKLAFDSEKIIKKLSQAGIDFIKDGESFHRRKPPGHSIARNIPTNWSGISYLNRGLTFSLPIAKLCRELKVQIVEGLSLVEILQTDNKVYGALFLDKEEQVIIYKTSNIILATGGFGYLFEQSNNTSDIFGEGLSAALNAGCKLQDMEQIQFYPTMMFEPIKMTVSNPLFGIGAVLRNKKHEKFMHKYDENHEMATRDNMARGIFQEIQSGLGINGRVYFDCRNIDPNKLHNNYGEFCEFLAKKNLDPSKDLLLVSPCVHYTLGGIAIDEEGKTNLRGLYAAGEITGGVHGANRLSGAALMEAAVFGFQAGETAGKNIIVSDELEVVLPEIKRCTTSLNIDAMIKKIRKIMWDKCSLIRNPEDLEIALEEIILMQKKLPEGYSKELCKVRAILQISEVVIRSALERKDSRGAHYRTDAPTAKEEFAGNIVVSKVANKFMFSLEHNQ